VRREQAIDYLTNSAHPLGEVARLIGYSTPSSFNRWFYSKFGLAPSAWRAGERPPEPDYRESPAAVPREAHHGAPRALGSLRGPRFSHRRGFAA
jgi:AraC-like DNA-binding protein